MIVETPADAEGVEAKRQRQSMWSHARARQDARNQAKFAMSSHHAEKSAHCALRNFQQADRMRTHQAGAGVDMLASCRAGHCSLLHFDDCCERGTGIAIVSARVDSSSHSFTTPACSTRSESGGSSTGLAIALPLSDKRWMR